MCLDNKAQWSSKLEELIAQARIFQSVHWTDGGKQLNPNVSLCHLSLIEILKSQMGDESTINLKISGSILIKAKK
ncbi:hypothetical protein BLOT_006515 [Blomia tropicalis]|nr:hypothetical protein BLOT_006515 [Blomia tropicalis]